MDNKEKRKELLVRLYFDKYETMVLSRKQLAKIVGKSKSTIDRWKNNGKGPAFQKNDDSKNGNVTYMIDTVVDFLLDHLEYRTIDQKAV